MSKLLKNLFMFLFPHAEDAGAADNVDVGDVGGDDGDADQVDGLDAGDAGDGDEIPPEDGDGEAPADTAVRATRRDRDVATLREERQRAEARAEAAERFAREVAQPLMPRGPTPEQVQWQQEQQRLADPTTSDIEKWQIDANRHMRQQAANTQRLHMETMERADRTEYAIKAAKNPLYEKYADKVETKLQEMRGRGYNDSRENVLKYLIGEDMVGGKFRSGSPKTNTVARGKSPGVRSDVSAKSGQSKAAQLAKRLEGKFI